MSLAGYRQREIVLVSYSGDEWYHERCLLGFLEGQVCVATPHWDLYVEHVGDYASLQSIGARGRLPPGLCGAREPQVVRFDRAELRQRLPGLLREAKEAEPNLEDNPVDDPAGEAAPGDDAGTLWVALETRGGVNRGDPIDPKKWTVTATGDRGVAVSGSVSVAVGAVGTLESGAVPAAPKLADGAGEDLRTLPVQFDGRGDRDRDYAKSTMELTETSFEDWQLSGPRTCLWLQSAIRKQGFTPNNRHAWWRNSLGLSIVDAGVEEHGMLSDLMETALVYDALNLPELMCFEMVARRYQVWEEFYKDSLRASHAKGDLDATLDLEEKDLFLGQRHARGAALVCPALEEHVAEKLRVRSSIQKERRKAREERTLQPQPAQPSPKRRGGKGKDGKDREGS